MVDRMLELGDPEGRAFGSVSGVRRGAAGAGGRNSALARSTAIAHDTPLRYGHTCGLQRHWLLRNRGLRVRALARQGHARPRLASDRS